MRQNPKVERYNVLEFENTMTQKRSYYRVRYRSFPLLKSNYCENDIYSYEERNFRKMLRQANQGLNKEIITPSQPTTFINLDPPPQKEYRISFKNTESKEPPAATSSQHFPMNEPTPEPPSIEVNKIHKAETLTPPPKEVVIKKKPKEIVLNSPPKEQEHTIRKKLSSEATKVIMEKERIHSLINSDGYYDDRKPKDLGEEQYIPQSNQSVYIKAGIIGIGILLVIGAMIYYILYYL